MRKNNFNWIYFCESTLLIAMMFFFGFSFIQQSDSSRIINYPSYLSLDFKNLSQDYLRTDLKDIDFKRYFDNETEQMIQNPKNIYPFLETCLTAALNEKKPVRKKFYFDWAYNVFNSIPAEYQNTPALSIVQAKIIYFQNARNNQSIDSTAVLQKLSAIPESHNLFSIAQAWRVRLLSLGQDFKTTQSQWLDLSQKPEFKYKEMFAKCISNTGELGCL